MEDWNLVFSLGSNQPFCLSTHFAALTSNYVEGYELKSTIFVSCAIVVRSRCESSRGEKCGSRKMGNTSVKYRLFRPSIPTDLFVGMMMIFSP